MARREHFIKIACPKICLVGISAREDGSLELLQRDLIANRTKVRLCHGSAKHLHTVQTTAAAIGLVKQRNE